MNKCAISVSDKRDLIQDWRSGHPSRIGRVVRKTRRGTGRPAAHVHRAAVSSTQRSTARAGPGPPAGRGGVSGRSASGANTWRLWRVPHTYSAQRCMRVFSSSTDLFSYRRSRSHSPPSEPNTVHEREWACSSVRPPLFGHASGSHAEPVFRLSPHRGVAWATAYRSWLSRASML